MEKKKMRLADKVTVITESGSGFGEGIAKACTNEGTSVVVSDINEDGGKRVTEENAVAGGMVRPRPGPTWYNTSKGAVTTLTKSMAIELAPNHIRVNALNPVASNTPLLPTFLGEDKPENREAPRATVPLAAY
jgi:3-oxoacyl-[acyl-carrier protein] reductase